jgi:hypothetical protein
MTNQTHTFDVGTFRCTLMNDGVNRTAAEHLFSDIPAAERTAAMTQAGFDPASVTLDINILLVQTGA